MCELRLRVKQSRIRLRRYSEARQESGCEDSARALPLDEIWKNERKILEKSTFDYQAVSATVQWHTNKQTVANITTTTVE